MTNPGSGPSPSKAVWFWGTVCRAGLRRKGTSFTFLCSFRLVHQASLNLSLFHRDPAASLSSNHRLALLASPPASVPDTWTHPWGRGRLSELVGTSQLRVGRCLGGRREGEDLRDGVSCRA